MRQAGMTKMAEVWLCGCAAAEGALPIGRRAGVTRRSQLTRYVCFQALKSHVMAKAMIAVF